MAHQKFPDCLKTLTWWPGVGCMTGANHKVCHAIAFTNINNPLGAPPVCISLFLVLRGHRMS